MKYTDSQERTPLGTLANGDEVYDREDLSHIHYGASHDARFAFKTALPAVLGTVRPEKGQDFVIKTVDMGLPVFEKACVEVGPKERVVYAVREGRRGYSPIAPGRELEPTSKITVIVRKVGEAAWEMVSAWQGEQAQPEPWDKRLSSKGRATSEEFWGGHALVLTPEDKLDMSQPILSRQEYEDWLQFQKAKRQGLDCYLNGETVEHDKDLMEARRSHRIVYSDDKMKFIRSMSPDMIYLMAGAPGSGKSSFARLMREFHEQNGREVCVASSDALRAELFGDARIQKSPKISGKDIMQMTIDRARQAKADGKLVIIDTTLASLPTQRMMSEQLRSTGAKLTVVQVTATMEELQERNRARDRVVPEPVQKAMVNMLRNKPLQQGNGRGEFDEIVTIVNSQQPSYEQAYL